MKITSFGAAGGEVTGSAYLVETSRSRVLVDCGMFQGGKDTEARNQLPAPVTSGIDAVLLTHGHLDHTGRLPLLAKIGFNGPIHCTPATIDLTALILRDSAKIQVQDAERANRKQLGNGRKPAVPLYTVEDAEAIIPRLATVPYRQPVTIAPDLQATWTEAGHMLGSASILLTCEESGRRKHVVFSGDLGPKGAPILRDYEPFKHADLVFLESTYGDRDHRSLQATIDQLVSIVKEAVSTSGKLIVPTFAIGKAQLLTFLMSWMVRSGEIKPFPIFLDSPMAIEASRIYMRYGNLFDDEMVKYIREKPILQDLRMMKATSTADESKAINDVPGPCMIMAGSGMCTAGRILHHLKNNLAKPENHVIVSSFQAHGSLGRRLVDGEKLVRIFGEEIPVAAKIHTLGGFSAHAGQTDLLEWFDALALAKPRVALTHGEDRARTGLAGKIKQRYGIEARLPNLGEMIEV